MGMAMLMSGLKDFAVQILRAASEGRPLNDEALNEIKAICVTNLKNSSTTGIPIEEEAKLFGQSIQGLENMIESAISTSRQI